MDESISGTKKRLRAASTKPPYFEIRKDDVHAILEHVVHGHVTSTIAVFTALRLLANDAGAPQGPFTKTIALIGSHAGTSYNTTLKCLGLIESLGLITVERQMTAGTKERGPSYYTFSNGCRTLLQRPTAPVAERLKESKEEETEETGAKAGLAGSARLRSGAARVPSLEEALKYAAKAGVARDLVEVWFTCSESNNWRLPDRMTGRPKPIENWKQALLAFARTDKQRPAPSLDKVANSDFWEWVESEGLDKEAVNAWITHSTKHNWCRRNLKNGRMEKIFDFRKSCRAWCAFADEHHAYPMQGIC